MKTLLLTTSFLPSYGGIESYLHELAKALYDHELTVTAPVIPNSNIFDRSASFKILRYNRNPEALSYCNALCNLSQNLFKRRWPSARKPWQMSGRLLPALGVLLASRSLLKSLAAQSRLFAADPTLLPTDLVQAGTAFPSGIIGWIIHHRFGTPYVVYTYGMEILLWGSSLRTRCLLRRVLSESAWVGAVSGFTAGLLKEFGLPEEAIRLVPPGIDPEPFCHPQDVQRLREHFGLSSKRVILTHGRLDPRKGHDMVLRALAEVVSLYQDTIYLITGTGPNEATLRALVRELDLERYVIFGGRVPNEFIPALYQTCDVFVMASRQINQSVEGFGIVCLEAAAAGRPVIAGRSGGVADAVVDGVTGYLVNPENPYEIASRLMQLLGDRTLREQLGMAGRERVQQDFNANAFARRLRGYLEEATEINSIRK